MTTTTTAFPKSICLVTANQIKKIIKCRTADTGGWKCFVLSMTPFEQYSLFHRWSQFKSLAQINIFTPSCHVAKCLNLCIVEKIHNFSIECHTRAGCVASYQGWNIFLTKPKRWRLYEKNSCALWVNEPRRAENQALWKVRIMVEMKHNGW